MTTYIRYHCVLRNWRAVCRFWISRDYKNIVTVQISRLFVQPNEYQSYPIYYLTFYSTFPSSLLNRLWYDTVISLIYLVSQYSQASPFHSVRPHLRNSQPIHQLQICQGWNLFPESGAIIQNIDEPVDPRLIGDDSRAVSKSKTGCRMEYWKSHGILKVAFDNFIMLSLEKWNYLRESATNRYK